MQIYKMAPVVGPILVARIVKTELRQLMNLLTLQKSFYGWGSNLQSWPLVAGSVCDTCGIGAF